MNARRKFAVAATVACLGLSVVPVSVSAHGRHTIRRYTLSHFHPEGKSSSYLCAGFVVNRGHAVVVSVVSGPGTVEGSPARGFARGRASQTIAALASFRVSTPGTYRVRTVLRSRTGQVVRRRSANYTVPPAPPEGEVAGLIDCPSPANDSFPD
ncbi:MAG: hypothetical protein ACRDKT_17140 [Actinomycetota bacterium]